MYFFRLFSLWVLLTISLGIVGQTPVSFNTSGTWTCPSGVYSIQVECWGAGGGGGGTTSSSSKYTGGGGAGGNYVKNISVNVTPGLSYTVTVGVGGSGGGTSTSTCNGYAGGNSSFSGNGITGITAAGGAAGLGGQSSLTAGTGGLASSANNAGFTSGFSYTGGSGTTATWVSSTNGKSGPGGGAAGTNGNGSTTTTGNTTGGVAGNGGGNGGAGLTATGAGNTGSAPGGGGGGGYGSSGTGGKGGNGLVIITYVVNSSFIGNPSPASLTGFSYDVSTGGPSNTQYFVFSASGLSSPLWVKAPTHFEISLTNNGTFTDSISISSTDIPTDSIFVRMKSALASGNYNNEDINISSGSLTQKAVSCSGSVSNLQPTISLSGYGPFNGFSYSLGSGPSASQSFVISGQLLTGLVTLNSTGDYEISSQSNASFGSVITLSPVNGNLSSTNIYIRLKAGLSEGNYNNQSILVNTNGVNPVSLICNGSVSSLPTSYVENFSTTNLVTTPYTTTTFTTTLGTWTVGGGGCGLSTSAINGNTMKLKIGVLSSATTPLLRGVSAISYTAKTTGANSTLTVTDGNGSFSDTKTITTSNTLSGNINVPSNSSGFYTFSYPANTSVTYEYLDDIIFSFKRPVSQASNVNVNMLSATSMQIDWSRPNNGNDNQGCVVFVGPADSTFINPANGTSYIANSIFTNAQSIPNSGYRCVYNGNGNTTTVTGLTSGNNYRVVVMEYNGVKGLSDEIYNNIDPALYPQNGAYIHIPVPTLLDGTNFTYLTDQGPSSSQSFLISANRLSGPLLISAPSSFELSLNANFGFSNSISIPPTSDSNINTTNIYVRLKSGLITGSYTQTIQISTAGATMRQVTCIGSVIQPTVPIIYTPSSTLLSGFNYGYNNGPSPEQRFDIAADFLIDTLKIQVSNAAFEISTNATTGYISAPNVMKILPTDSAVSTTIFVRLKSGLPIGDYSNTILTLSSTGAISKTVICNGNVTLNGVVLQQPNSVTVCEGDAAFFNCTSSISSAVKWQRSTDGASWTDITANLDAGVVYSGFSTDTLRLNTTISGLNYFQYRAMYGVFFSRPATLTVSRNLTGQINISGNNAVCEGNSINLSANIQSNTTGQNINPDNFIVSKFSTVNVTSNVAYGSPDGTFHLVDIYAPAGDTTSNRPAVMFLHGGGFRNGNDKTQSYVVAFCTYLAKCGYVAFAPNYNVGGGHTFAQNLAAVKDADLCLNWIRSNGATYKYNPNYLFVGGGSAGGHLICNFMLSDNGPNYQGYVVNKNNVIAYANCWGSSPDADRLYDFNSINSQSAPMFAVHGTADQTVPIQETITLNGFYVIAGAVSNFWSIPGETHGCPNHRDAIGDTMARFFNRIWKQSGNYSGTTGSIPVSGGVWSSNNTSIATVNPASGIVSGISAGTASITYTVNSCNGILSATKTITVDPGKIQRDSTTACNSYTWRGNTYTASGEKQMIKNNAAGCDSVYLLQLTIKKSSSSYTQKSICSDSIPYIWNGIVCNESGNYTFNTNNAGGCDSSAFLSLQVNSCTVSLKVKLILEGFHNANGLMDAGLFQAGLLNDSNAVDTITIDLWNPLHLNNNFPDYSSKAVLRTNGEAQIILPQSLNGNVFYIAIRHRNSVETWSSNAVLMSGNVQYDFTDGLMKSFSLDNITGSTKLIGPSRFAMLSGDVNQDGAIDLLDMVEVYNSASQMEFGYLPGDCNGDGAVDLLDMVIVYNNLRLFVFYQRPW